MKVDLKLLEKFKNQPKEYNDWVVTSIINRDDILKSSGMIIAYLLVIISILTMTVLGNEILSYICLAAIIIVMVVESKISHNQKNLIQTYKHYKKWDNYNLKIEK